MAPYYEQDGIVIYHGDCREILPALPVVDHVITDPPYSDYVHAKSRAGSRKLSGSASGGSLTARANISRAVDFGFESLNSETREFYGRWFAKARRWCLVFSDVESTMLWRETLTDPDYGTQEYIRTGAWVKVGATPQFTGDRPGVGFEAITICHQKGRKRWNGGGRHALWTYPIVLDRGRQSAMEWRCHPTQKPEALICNLILDFTDPGELILDAFMGSGTALVQAKRHGRKAIGIEVSEQFCEVAAKRLSQGALALEMGE